MVSTSDYWDRLGWRDPFSSPAYSTRQSTYDDGVFRVHEVYTPQPVIDGRFEVVATALPKAAVEVTVSRRHDRELDVDVRVDVPPALTLRESVDVLIAVTEDNLQREVRRGENRGRTLRHSAVVRSLASVGTLLPQDRAWSTKTSVVLAPEWTPANVRVVSFLQERKSHYIVGGGATRLSADAHTGHIE